MQSQDSKTPEIAHSVKKVDIELIEIQEDKTTPEISREAIQVQKPLTEENTQS